MTRLFRSLTGGRRTQAHATATPTRGVRRMPVIHEADAQLNARPHTTRLLVQAINRPGGTST